MGGRQAGYPYLGILQLAKKPVLWDRKSIFSGVIRHCLFMLSIGTE